RAFLATLARVVGVALVAVEVAEQQTLPGHLPLRDLIAGRERGGGFRRARLLAGLSRRQILGRLLLGLGLGFGFRFGLGLLRLRLRLGFGLRRRRRRQLDLRLGRLDLLGLLDLRFGFGFRLGLRRGWRRRFGQRRQLQHHGR